VEVPEPVMLPGVNIMLRVSEEDPDNARLFANPFFAVIVMVETALTPKLTGSTSVGLALIVKSTTLKRILPVE